MPFSGFVFFLLLSIVLLQACAKPAYLQVDQTASELGLRKSVVQGENFQHVVYRSMAKPTKRLHVYIEGDGLAWRMRTIVSRDPTPRNPLMLRLMGMDSADTLYVGRPCYFGLAPSAACDSDYWTYSRFSTPVIKSMASAIRTEAAAYQSVVLIGHSGGGALAMLIAEQLPRVEAVVTLAGNLDTDAWTSLHGYTPLHDSLNPATRQPLPTTIRQLHLLGGQDEIIPPDIVTGWITRQQSAQKWLYEKFNHSCCWAGVWSDVLRWIGLGTGGSV